MVLKCLALQGTSTKAMKKLDVSKVDLLGV